MCEGVGEDSGHVHDESFIACRILGIDLHVLLGMCVLLCEHVIACALRWGVTLVGVYSTWLCSPRCGPYPIHGPARLAFKWKENVKRKCGLIFEF